MKARWTLSLPQTSRANPVQCCSTHQKKCDSYASEIVKSQLPLSIVFTQFTVYNHCKTAHSCDFFAEILKSQLPFSIVFTQFTLYNHWLCMSTRKIVENFYKMRGFVLLWYQRIRHSQKSVHDSIYRVQSLYSWLLRISTRSWGSHSRDFNRSEILKSQPTTQLTVYNHCKSDLWEFVTDEGIRTLVISTDPAHSLGDCLDIKLSGVISLIHMCDMTYSHVWLDSLTCVTWLIHMRDMDIKFSGMIAHIYMRDMPYLCVWHC